MSNSRRSHDTKLKAIYLDRILRLLSTVHLVEESAVRTWSANRITKAMAREEIAAGHRFKLVL